MYCEGCNIDFPEGLRYCKWCGQALSETRRITSELQTCPACEAPVQPKWTFCKSCGAKLSGETQERGETPERTAAESGQETSVIAHCPSCGEKVDTGSIYCKGCGAPVYSPPRPFGASSLLCRICSSYSPLGSSVCRVCGAPLEQVEASPVAASSNETAEKDSSTLPDLSEMMPRLPTVEPKRETGKIRPEPSVGEVDSGAHTFVFDLSDSEQQQAPTEVIEGSPGETATVALNDASSGSSETTVLQGASEQQTPTTLLKTGRITAPVDTDPLDGEQPSGGLVRPTSQSLVTRIDAESYNPQEGDPVADDQTVDFGRVRTGDQREARRPSDDPGTSFIGSGSPPDAFVSREGGVGVPSDEAQISAPLLNRDLAAPPSQFDQASQGSGSDPIYSQSEAVTEIRPYQVPSQGPPTRQQQISESVRAAFAMQNAQATVQPTRVQQAPTKQKAAAPIISVIVGLIVLGASGAAAWWYIAGGSKPAPAQPETIAVTPAPEPQPKPPSPPPTAPEGMVLVPAGSYIIGRDDGDDISKPQRTVRLSGFYIDRTEVTNADFKRFVDATGHKAPQGWVNGTYPAGRDNWPVVSVSWQDAADYAAWAGKRLPTEAEWEAAARGSDGRVYPWGNEWRTGLANIGASSIIEVGQYREGASPAGALDMIGNVWEWTADEFELYLGSPAPMPSTIIQGLKSGVTFRVIRGGAYDGTKVNDAAYRGFVDASKGYPKTGFRCAKDAK